ncbi:tellurite resistance TerB family protein [Cardiobacteriaceae bacterium TAE3-ERU3]|nr:tellurite resistance TerB family protein [Cardiobacteriaceae bacterium TAE3-ERU3]
MNLNSLLNNVLSTGQKMLQDKVGNNPNTHNQNASKSSNNFDFLNSFGGGAATAGLLSLLLGTKSGRGISKNVVKLGSMAAIGTLAYKAYQSWQKQNSSNQPTNAASLQPTHERPAIQQEQDSQVILQTMIAAACADGRVEQQEQQAILNEVDHSDHEAKVWLEEQLRNPQTPAQLASKIGDDHALAAESYLAARIVCGDLDRKEIVFLHELSNALGLDDQLVSKLEEQAGF